jgi:hypothetical protein
LSCSSASERLMFAAPSRSTRAISSAESIRKGGWNEFQCFLCLRQGLPAKQPRAVRAQQPGAAKSVAEGRAERRGGRVPVKVGGDDVEV